MELEIVSVKKISFMKRETESTLDVGVQKRSFFVIISMLMFEVYVL